MKQWIFFKNFATRISHREEYLAKEIDGGMVHQSFRNTAKSAGAMDGWRLKELAQIRKTCGYIATMLRQREEGAPWPKSTTHARVVYLEKVGAAMGEVMSHRPLTITAPFYRCWATTRLRSIVE